MIQEKPKIEVAIWATKLSTQNLGKNGDCCGESFVIIVYIQISMRGKKREKETISIQYY